MNAGSGVCVTRKSPLDGFSWTKRSEEEMSGELWVEERSPMGVQATKELS